MKKLLLSGVALFALQTVANANCPAVTVAEMNGVAAGKYPQQFELSEFEGAANCKMEFSANPDIEKFNGMIQGSYQPSTNFNTRFFGVNGDLVREEDRIDSGELSIGPDFAVGAQFALAENIALDIRYRAILYFPISGDFDFGDTRVNHGGNLGVSFRL